MEFLILIEFDFSSFSLPLVLLVSLKKPFPSPKSQVYSYVYLEEFLWFCPPLRSVTHLELFCIWCEVGVLPRSSLPMDICCPRRAMVC